MPVVVAIAVVDDVVAVVMVEVASGFRGHADTASERHSPARPVVHRYRRHDAGRPMLDDAHDLDMLHLDVEQQQCVRVCAGASVRAGV